MKRLNLIISIFALSLVAMAASKAPSKEPTKTPKAATEATPTNLMSLQKEIQMLSKESRKCDKSSDCDTLPMGQKLCGGPKMHVIVSKKSSNFKKLQEMTKKHTAQAKAINSTQKKGMFGTCSVVMAPPVECKDNICKQKIVSFNK